MKDVFFKVPVTNLGDVPVQASGVALVTQASTTTVTIQYVSGLILTLTHATAGASDETARDEVFAGIKDALKQHWQQVDEVTISPTYAVSAIAASHVVVPAT